MKKRNERQRKNYHSRTPEQVENDRYMKANYYISNNLNDKKKIKYNKRKQHIVNLLGGGCTICGYNKYMGAIDLHETERLLKSIPSRLIQIDEGYKSLLDNINILIPLCRNCHAEYHAGLIELPVKPSTNNQK